MAWVRAYVGVAIFSLPLFLAAGRLDYPPGWRYLALALVGTAMSQALTPAGSDLAERRAAEAGAGEAWDRRLLGGMFLANLVGFVVAGLDSGRYGWSGGLPLGVVIAGGAAMLAGQAVFAAAKRANAFFSATVRLQEERGHAVCETGPYRWVRHPGYAGLLLSQLAFPVVTEALCAYGPVLVGAALLVARTAREDRFLAERLTGYAEYSRRTRWRLVPGVY